MDQTPNQPSDHTEKEDHGWDINIPAHPSRSSSPYFDHSKTLAKKILASMSNYYTYDDTDDQIQMHHGGSLYVYDGINWALFKNLAGIEWSAQFCADPARVEALRQNAVILYKGFPQTIPQMESLGYPDTDILNTPISDAEGVAKWVDSIFNCCLPLPSKRHAAVLTTGAGVHHYPTPITDIELIKYSDFTLWVTSSTNTQVAVVPVAPRGAGVNKTQLVYAPDLTYMHHQLMESSLIEFSEDNILTKQAFKNQK